MSILFVKYIIAKHIFLIQNMLKIVFQKNKK